MLHSDIILKLRNRKANRFIHPLPMSTLLLHTADQLAKDKLKTAPSISLSQVVLFYNYATGEQWSAG